MNFVLRTLNLTVLTNTVFVINFHKTFQIFGIGKEKKYIDKKFLHT